MQPFGATPIHGFAMPRCPILGVNRSSNANSHNGRIPIRIRAPRYRAAPEPSRRPPSARAAATYPIPLASTTDTTKEIRVSGSVTPKRDDVGQHRGTGDE